MTNKRYVESSYKRLTEIKTMRNAVMNTWKHNNPIDWDDIEASISDVPDGTTIQWFAIDEHNHGSFVTFACKEVYEHHKVKVDAYRKDKN